MGASWWCGRPVLDKCFRVGLNCAEYHTNEKEHPWGISYRQTVHWRFYYSITLFLHLVYMFVQLKSYVYMVLLCLPLWPLKGSRWKECMYQGIICWCLIYSLLLWALHLFGGGTVAVPVNSLCHALSLPSFWWSCSQRELTLSCTEPSIFLLEAQWQSQWFLLLFWEWLTCAVYKSFYFRCPSDCQVCTSIWTGLDISWEIPGIPRKYWELSMETQ